MRAFTLVEVLVSAFILSVMVIAVTLVLNTGSLTYNVDAGVLTLRQQSRQAMERMVKELRQATSKSILSGGAVITFTTAAASNIQYYRDTNSNQAIREYPAGAKQVLGNFISSLSFCCMHSGACDADCSASDLVRISLSANTTARGKALSYQAQEQVRLRNE